MFFEFISHKANFDFVGKRFIWLGISGGAILLTFVLFFTKGLNYGIDFTGGAEVQIRVPGDTDIGRVRRVLSDGGVEIARLQQAGSAQEYLVRVQGDEKALGQIGSQISEALKKGFPTGGYSIERSDVVGPAAGGSLRQNGFFAMVYALLAILCYVAVRFDMRFAPGAVIALFHDTVITVGAFIITQKQFDLTIVAAVLALIGYSNNDTIIVFDRVRETLKMSPSMSIEQAVNRSINETLGRTLMTSLTTFVVTVAIYLLGGAVIENFAFTLLIGIVVGSYSSVFIAGTLVIFMHHRQEKRVLRSV